MSGITDTSEEANEVSGSGAVLTIDNIAPEVTSVKKNNNENGFIISYSEPVEGADDPANYKVMLDGEEQDISKIAGSGDTDSGSYELILKKHLKNAEYKVYFENITDAKTGKNELAETEKTVIATGGSVVYGKEAMDHYKNIGKVVYLKVDMDTLTKRLHNAKQRGVVMREGQSLVSLYNERSALYEKYADITIEEKDFTMEEVIDITLEALKALPL